MDRLYSIPEAAGVLGNISKRTVETWLSKGKMQRTKVGRRTLIQESELRRFVEVSTAAPVGVDGHRKVA